MTESKFVYLAGLLDGEGTIGVYRESYGNKKCTKKRIRIRMMIASTSIKLMEYLKENFGVTYIQKCDPKHQRLGKKVLYHAVFNEHQIRDFGEKMLPFLVIKRERMEKALEAIKSKNLRKYGKWK